MRVLLSSVVALLALSACTSIPEIDAADPADTVEVAENYQEVYARSYRLARQCWQTGPSPFNSITNDVDGQLFSELGYGEILFFQRNLKQIHWASVRIERTPAGTVVSVRTANAMPYVQSGWRRQVLRWAGGSPTC